MSIINSQLSILQTPVNCRPLPFRIDHTSQLMLMGSCFSDAIGSKLQQSGIPTLVNPFGTLFNPISIALCLERVLNNTPMSDDDLVLHDGIWHSWLHHSRFSSTDRQGCLDRCNQSIGEARQFLASADCLIITFGTAYLFQLADDGRVVSNCHKVPAQRFRRRLASPEEIVGRWSPLMEHIAQFNPNIHIVFTVSPIRHMADGAHGNQISKSTLLLAEEQLVETATTLPYPPSYFPSYEIMMDQLRDYRFYDRDMVHPSDLAIDLIFQQFQNATMDNKTIEDCATAIRHHKQSQHRDIVKS